MIYKPGTVVVVPFPFTDKATTKKRPALVMNEEAYQVSTGHLILLMITSAKQSRWTSDTEIQDLDSAGLPSPSVVRQKVFTLDERLILKAIGKLDENDWTTVKSEFKTNLAI